MCSPGEARWDYEEGASSRAKADLASRKKAFARRTSYAGGFFRKGLGSRVVPTAVFGFLLKKRASSAFRAQGREALQDGTLPHADLITQQQQLAKL